MSRRFGTVPFISGMFVNVLKPHLLVIDLKLQSCVVACCWVVGNHFEIAKQDALYSSVQGMVCEY